MKPSTGHLANISVITAAESVRSTRNTHFAGLLAVSIRGKVNDMLAIHTCKDCLDRNIGCHGSCQKYLEAKSENERKKDWLYRKKEAEKDIEEYRIKAVDAIKRRKH